MIAWKWKPLAYARGSRRAALASGPALVRISVTPLPGYGLTAAHPPLGDSLVKRSIAPSRRFVAHYVTDAIRPLEVHLWKFT